MSTLSQIVEPTDKKQKAEYGVEQHVTIDLKKRKILAKPPFFSWPFGSIRYFLVRNQNHTSGTVQLAEMFHRSSLQSKSGTLGFHVGGNVSCISGKEEETVLALCHYPDAQKGFEYNLRQWIDSYCSTLGQDRNFCFDEVIIGLSSQLHESAYAMGLSFQPEIRIVEQDQVSDLSWNQLKVGAFLRGSDVETSLWMNIQTEVHGGNASALTNRPMLEKTLERRMVSAVCTLLQEEVTPSIYYYQRRGRLKRRVSDELEPLLQEAGLMLSHLDLDGVAPPLQEGECKVVEHQSTREMGDETKQQVEIYIKAALTITEIGIFVDAARERSPEDLALSEIEKTLIAMTDSMDFSGVGTPDSMRDRLRELFSKRMALLGIKAEILGFSIKTPNLTLAPFFEKEVVIPYTLFGSGEEINFRNKVQMSLTNKQLYMQKGHPDLEVWSRENLDRFLRRELFAFDYTKLVLSFQDRIPLQIETAMKESAQQIGYHLDILTVQPDLEPLSWKESFQVKISEPFPTIVPNCKVELQILVRMRIPDLNYPNLKKYISPNLDIKQIIIDELQECLMPYFHGLSPEHYYIQFDSTQQGENGLDEPVKETVAKLIREILTDRFGAEVDTLSLKQLETGITKHLEELMKSNPDFSVTFSPHSSHETFVFNGRLKVIGVNPKGWPSFQRGLHKTVDHLVESVSHHLTRNLEVMPAEAFAYQDPDHQRALMQKVQELVDECARNEFGLSLQLLSFGREKSFIEELQTNLERQELELRVAGQVIAIQEKHRDLSHYQKQMAVQRQSALDNQKNILNAIAAKAALTGARAAEDWKTLQERASVHRPDSLQLEINQIEQRKPRYAQRNEELDPIAALKGVQTFESSNALFNPRLESGSTTNQPNDTANSKETDAESTRPNKPDEQG